MFVSAAVWDVSGALGVLPPWWPPVGYVLAAAGVVAACVAALLTMFTVRRATSTAAAPALSAPVRARGIGGQLLAAGVLLAAWLLRGHAEIPPDPPLVAAELAAAALYVIFSRTRPSA